MNVLIEAQCVQYAVFVCLRVYCVRTVLCSSCCVSLSHTVSAGIVSSFITYEGSVLISLVHFKVTVSAVFHSHRKGTNNLLKV